VKLKLVPARSGAVVWNDTVSATISYHVSLNPGKDVLFKLTLNNLIDQLCDNNDLLRALGTASRTAGGET